MRCNMKKNTFGETLKEIRKENKFTLKELATQAGTSDSYLSQLETGARNPPKPKLLQDISAALSKNDYKKSIEYYALLSAHAGYSTSNELILKREELGNAKTRIKIEVDAVNSKLKVIAFQFDRFYKIDKLSSADEKKIAELMNDKNKLEKERENFQDQLENLSDEIDEINDLIRQSLEFKEATQAKNMIENVVGEAESTVELENIFNIAQEITLNGKTLTDEEKQKALQILKLTFDK